MKTYLEGLDKMEFEQEIKEEFVEMLKSVAMYGGFYVGRYETGNINQNKPVVSKENNNISNVNWYKMYLRCRNLRGMNPVHSGLIWGIQWDEILLWLIKSGEKTEEEIYNAYDWGNFSYGKQSSGYSETWKANNIYDFAGNVFERTMDASEGAIGTLRGGCYNGNYIQYGVSARTIYPFSSPTWPYTSDVRVGCRAILYIV